MDDYKLILWCIVAYAVIFFFMSLKDHRNVKDAFFDWIETMRGWGKIAVEGLIFLGILFIFGIALG